MKNPKSKFSVLLALPLAMRLLGLAQSYTMD